MSGSAGAGGGAAGSGGASSAGAGGTPNGGTGGTSGTAVCTGGSGKVVAVHLIGDSTMSLYASDLFPRMGWGQPLGELFGPACAIVKNWAASGRSSKSFFDEGKWTPVRDGLAAGDYVLIQFGHNDEKTDDPLRYTEPQTTFKQYLTTYIEEAREKQATPMLLTPIHRNNWTGATIKDTHAGYPAAMRELAAALEVELVDLTALTEDYFERIGQEETTQHFLVLAPGEFPNYPEGNTDNTHLQEYGARKIGQLAMANAYTQGLTLASYLASVPAAP
jgi:lysophospholipase L1-like esterase